MAPAVLLHIVQAERIHPRDMRGVLTAVSRIHGVGAVSRPPSSVEVLVVPVEVFQDAEPQPVAGGGEGDKRDESRQGGLETHGEAKSDSVRGRHSS